MADLSKMTSEQLAEKACQLMAAKDTIRADLEAIRAEESKRALAAWADTLSDAQKDILVAGVTATAGAEGSVS